MLIMRFGGDFVTFRESQASCFPSFPLYAKLSYLDIYQGNMRVAENKFHMLTNPLSCHDHTCILVIIFEPVQRTISLLIFF